MEAPLNRIFSLYEIRHILLRMLSENETQNLCLVFGYILATSEKIRYLRYTCLGCGVSVRLYDTPDGHYKTPRNDLDNSVSSEVSTKHYTTTGLETMIRIYTQYVKKCARDFETHKTLEFIWLDGTNKIAS